MIRITIPEIKGYDDNLGEFVNIPETIVDLEHSLLSVMKWEAKWHKAFLKEGNKTDEELLDYIRCMVITKNVDPYIFNFLGSENVQKIILYIQDPSSAVHLPDHGRNLTIDTKRDVITAEVLYYYMIKLNIPIEFQKWHLNRLITLINVIGIKDGNGNKKKKMTQAEKVAAAAQRDAINEERKARYKTRG